MAEEDLKLRKELEIAESELLGIYNDEVKYPYFKDRDGQKDITRRRDTVIRRLERAISEYRSEMIV